MFIAQSITDYDKFSLCDHTNLDINCKFLTPYKLYITSPKKITNTENVFKSY